MVLAAVVALAALGGAALTGLGLGPSSAAARYTDGRAIRVAARGAPVRMVLWRPAEPVAGLVNSSADEYEPRLSADGTVMVFVRGRAGANADLYESRWTPGGWTEPVAIAAINTAGDELGPELSADGEWLYFYSDRAGGLGGFDLYRSRRVGSEAGAPARPRRLGEAGGTGGSGAGWDEPVNLGPAVNSAFNEYGPALAPGGERLYFSSNRPRPGEEWVAPEGWPATVREVRGRHDYDLYEAEAGEAGPGAAAAVVALNTAWDEGAPAVSPAGDFVYFASDRPGGLGGFDVYRSRLSGVGEPAADRGRPGDSPDTRAERATYGPVEPVGGAVNSVFNDLDPGLSADGFRLVFSSDRPMARGEEGGAGPGAGDYGLWCSASREVYLEVDAGAWRAVWARAWDRLWPWLLLLLSSLLGAWLLARFARRAGWGGRRSAVGLLARCVIFSFAVHLVVASLLAVWRVGTTIGDLMREGGGAGGAGSRVLLTSGVAGDAIGRQIRGGAGELPALEAPMGGPARAAAPEVTVGTASARLDPPVMAMRDERGVEGVELEAGPAPERVESARMPEAPGVGAGVVASVPEEAGPGGPVAEREWRESSAVEIGGGRARAALDAAVAGAPDRFTVEVGRAIAGVEDRAARVDAAPWSAAPERPAEGAMPAALTRGGAASGEVALPGVERAGGAVEERGLDVGVDLGRAVAGPGAMALSGGAGGVRIDPEVTASAGRDVQRAAPEVAMGAMPGGAGAGGVDALAMPEAPGVSRDVEVSLPGGGREGSAGRGGAEPELTLGIETGGGLGAGASRAGVEGLGPAARAGDRIDIEAWGVGGSGGGDRAAKLELGPSMSEVEVGGGRGWSAGPALPLAGAGVIDGLRLPEVAAEPEETFAQRDPDPEVRGEIVERMGGSGETERAVSTALRWLAAHQEGDGRWSGRGFDEGCGSCGGGAEIESDTAMTGMALLCYLGAGHTHRAEGEHRETVARAIAWLVGREAGRGDLRRGETMYAQTIATVALCEALAMTADPGLRGPAQRAAAFVLDGSRRGRGGSDDTSVLGWQVMAVESARRAGIRVPEATFAAAERFLDRVEDRARGGRYAHGPGGRASAAMTAEAMFVRQLAGHGREEARMRESARFLLEMPPRWNAGAPTYYWYYATLALFQQQGEAWRAWNAALVPELLGHQRRDGPAAGSWDPQDEWSKLGGRIYQTAVCTLSLEVYYRYRPAGMVTTEGDGETERR